MLILTLTLIYSWGYKTHAILGEFTNLLLNSSKLNLILGNFSEASILPDKLKFTKEYAWTRKLHYIDIDLKEQNNFISDKIIKKYCKKNCITWGIPYFHKQIRNEKQLNLSLNKFRYHFLLHFLQDLTQPFHLFGKTGGNDIFLNCCDSEVCKSISIHKLWDTVLPEKYDLKFKSKFKFKLKHKFKLNRYINLHYHIAVKEYNYYKSVNFTLNITNYYNSRAKYILDDLFTNYKYLVLHYFQI